MLDVTQSVVQNARLMAPKSTFPLADKATGGQLAALLRNLRQQQASYVTIAMTLRADGIAVDPATVRRWCISEGIEPTDGAA